MSMVSASSGGMIDLQITVRQRGVLRDVMSRVKEGNVDKAIRAATRRTLSQAKTYTVREIQREITARPKSIKDRVSDRMGMRGNVEYATLRLSNRPIGLASFKHKEKKVRVSTSRQRAEYLAALTDLKRKRKPRARTVQRRAVYVNVYGRGMQLVDRNRIGQPAPNFLGTSNNAKNIFSRLSRNRLDIERNEGPSPADLLGKKSAKQNRFRLKLRNHIRRTYINNIVSQVSRFTKLSAADARASLGRAGFFNG